MKNLLLLLLLAAMLAAQNTSSALSGTVRDAAGAVIPNVKVTLTGEGNGFVRSVITTSEGYFSFPDLTPATFTLAIEAAGFKKYHQTGIAISAAQNRSLGSIGLEVGQVNDSVTVTAEAVTVDLATGEHSGTLTGDQLDEIALRGRDVMDAVSLMAGVIDTSDGRDAPGPTSIGNIYIMGGRNDQKNMTVDGVTNLDTGSNGSVHSMPSMDSVAEVKVLMSAYSAENGRNPSAINIITKGGDRQFHGSASYFFRNEALNANDFFANQAGRPKARYRYNIGSYTLSGPVVLPKPARLRNRMFFFFNQEFQRQVQNYGVKTVTVPTVLERGGDFSQSYNTGGVPGSFHVNDPLNNKAQFPGNVIPPSRMTPLGKAVLNLFPLPNYVDPNPATRAQWNYYANLSEPYPRRTESLRVDFSPRDNWQLYVSLSNNSDNQAVPYNAGSAGWVAGSLNFPLSPIQFGEPGRLGSVHSANAVTPTTFNEVVVAISQNTLTYAPLNPDLFDRTKLGITLAQRNPAQNVLNAIPNMSFGGIQNAANPSMSDGTPYFNQNTIYSFTDNVSKIWGTHSFKLGVYYENTNKIQSANAATRGNIAFNQDGNNPFDANNAYGTALLGYYDSYTEATGRPQGRYHYMNLEWFAQDTWRLRPNFSLDYGVRFYHDPPQYDERHQLASFSPAAYSAANAPVLLRPAKVNGQNVAQNPVTGEVYSNGLVGTFAPGSGDPANGLLIGGKNGVPEGLYTLPAVSVAPRAGFAWDPFQTGKTAVRGGGGVYYDRIQGNPVMNLLGPPAFYSPVNYYGSYGDIAATASAGLLSPTGTIYSLASNGHQQVVYNFNIEIQRQIGRSEVVNVGYSGSLGQHLLWQRNINPVPLGATFLKVHPENLNLQTTGTALSSNFLRPYQGWGSINLYEFANNSNYHALLATWQHRLRSGMNLTTNYTFSKVLDASDSYGSSVDAFLPVKARNYGPAGFDRRHVFSANFYWNLPKPGKMTGVRPLGWATDNWTVSGVVRMQTGAPVTPSYSLVNGIASPTGSGDASTRPQVIDPAAPLAQRFSPPFEPAGQAKVPWAIDSNDPQFGNLGKNTVIAPGTNNWDLSMYRNIKIGEKVASEFRVETYNTFNHTQFGGINTNLQFDSKGSMINAAFDTPNSARPPRRIQLALRIRF